MEALTSYFSIYNWKEAPTSYLLDATWRKFQLPNLTSSNRKEATTPFPCLIQLPWNINVDQYDTTSIIDNLSLLMSLIFLFLLLISISHQDYNHTYLIPRFTREFSKSNAYESLKNTCSWFLQNTHPNTHRKTYLQLVAEMSFRSLIFHTCSSQVCDFMIFLLVGIRTFIHNSQWMSTLFLLKPTYILKESMSKTSSPYSWLLQTSYFTGLLFLRLTASDIQPVFSEVIHGINSLIDSSLCFNEDLMMTCN